MWRQYGSLDDCEGINESIEMTIEYKDDIIHGDLKTFYKSKNLKIDMKYENGKKHGKTYIYDDANLLSNFLIIKKKEYYFDKDVLINTHSE